ncbi:MAG: carotenoid oxygenase family protein, partial [Rivularia sp. ALOHA_DT_140]|nr:carotenoid oxygenase family protein [Rivularia sp. ALOHA_DT_140]
MILPDGEIVSPDQTIHQMAITEDYIIFMDIAFKVEFSQIFSAFWLESIGKFKNIITNILNVINTLSLSVLDKYKDVVEDIFFKIAKWIYSKLLQFIPPEPYTNLYIVNRKSLSTKNQNQIEVKKVTIPFEVSHSTVDYKNPDNKIILHVGHNNGSDVTEWVREYDLPVHENKLRPELAGMIVGTTDLGRLARYVIDVESGVVSDKRVISDPRFTWSLSVYTHRELCNQSINETADTVKNIYWMSWGFSWETIPERIYKVYQNGRFRHIHHTQLPENYKPTQLLRLDTEKMEIVDSFEFPYGHFACTPQFIPSSL